MQDVFGSIEVGVHNDTAGFAFENCAFTLPSPQASTGGASFGCVSGGNKLNSNSELFSFIDEELLQLGERPVGEEPVLFVPMLCASNSLQIFQDDNSVSSCTFNQFSADAVVDISHETSLPASHFFQMPFGRMGAFASQPAAQTNITLLDLPDVLTFIEPSIGSSYQIIYSPVNSNCFSSLVGFVGELFYGNHQPEFPILASDKVAFFCLPSDKLPKIFRNFNLNLDASLSCEKAGDLLFKVNGATPCVVVNGFTRENSLPSFSFDGGLDCGTSVLIGDNGELGWQTEVLPKFTVSFVMYPERVGVFSIITSISDKVLGRSHPAESIIKNGFLRSILKNNRLHGFHHIGILETKVFKRVGSKTQSRRTAQFLPRLKSGVSLQGIL